MSHLLVKVEERIMIWLKTSLLCYMHDNVTNVIDYFS